MTAGRRSAPDGPWAQLGITLIELMIVMAVVGLLAAIAYPSYEQYVLRSRRTEGKAMMMDVVARLERHYMDENTYTTDPTELGFTSATPRSAEGRYEASIEEGPSGDIATSYTVTVTPQWSNGDAECGALTLDSRGEKGSSHGTVEQCWK